MNISLPPIHALMFGVLLALPAHADESPLNPADWGVYADLAGHTWTGKNFGEDWQIDVEWSVKDNALIERWEQKSGSRAGKTITNTITRGGGGGELRMTSTGAVCDNRTGQIQPDGTILFVCTGLFKWPMHVAAPRAGVMEQHYVKLDGGEIAGVNNTWRFSTAAARNAPGVAAASRDGTPSKMTELAVPGAIASDATPAREAVSPLAADWGVYASIADKEWRGASNVSIRWNKLGEELVEEWTYGAERGERAGQQQLVATIRRGAKPGSVVATIEGNEVAGTRTLTGKVRKDGSVQFSSPGLLLDTPAHTVSLQTPSRLEYFSFPPGNPNRTPLYLATGDGERPGSRSQLAETWGAYADLVGKHWLLDDRKILFTFEWIVPGEAMYVRTFSLNGDHVQNHHVARSAETGRLYAEPSLWGTWKADVILDGDHSIKLGTKGMLAWTMVFTRKADGGFEYYEDPLVGAAYTGSLVPVSRTDAPRLIAEAKEAKAEREREQRQRKRERREALNTAMTVVNSALVATSETLAQQQAEAAAAQQRYQTAVMERNRIAAEQERLEAAQREQRQAARGAPLTVSPAVPRSVTGGAPSPTSRQASSSGVEIAKPSRGIEPPAKPAGESARAEIGPTELTFFLRVGINGAINNANGVCISPLKKVPRPKTNGDANRLIEGYRQAFLAACAAQRNNAGVDWWRGEEPTRPLSFYFSHDWYPKNVAEEYARDRRYSISVPVN